PSPPLFPYTTLFRSLIDCLRRRWDAVMYLLVNQAVLGALPGHPPYVTWVIGREVFEPLTSMRRRALRRAAAVFSISKHTADEARSEEHTSELQSRFD